MKVCLISPPTVTDFEDPEMAETEAIRLIAEHAPLGILSLAAVLDANKVECELVDLNRVYYRFLRSDERKEGVQFSSYVCRQLESSPADVFGLSTICSSYPLTLRIARELRTCHAEAAIILGGPQASVVDAATIQTFPFIDCIVRGEGEDTLPLLLDAFCNGGPSELIPGITFRKADHVVRTPTPPILQDLDQLPFPAFHLYPDLKACSYVPLELGRGCPFACTFCSTNDFFRRRFRLKSPDRIVGEMKRVKETYGIGTFDLIHDMFTVDRKRVVAFCEVLLNSNEGFFWNCSARTDCVDQELIELMAQAGCRGIFFGIETGSARLQKVINKGLDLDEAFRQIQCTDRNEITTAVSLITGFPDETPQDVEDSVAFIMDSMRFDHAQPQLHLLAPLAQTPIYHEYRDRLFFDDIFSDMSYQGWRQDDSDREMIRTYADIFPNFYAVPTPHLNREYLRELREFVMNGTENFRWLTVALHQSQGSLVRVFDDFRGWYARNEGKGPSSPSDIGPYYSNVEFRRQVREFARTQYADRGGKMGTLLGAMLDYEESLEKALETAPPEEPAVVDGQKPQPLESSAVPKTAPGVRLSEVAADYSRLIRCLRRKGRLSRLPIRSTTIATRRDPDNRLVIILLSGLSAKLIRFCDGTRKVSDIAARLAAVEDFADINPEKACLFGLSLLQQQGLVSLSAADSLPCMGFAGQSNGEGSR